jgi:hypothetical protein
MTGEIGVQRLLTIERRQHAPFQTSKSALRAANSGHFGSPPARAMRSRISSR